MNPTALLYTNVQVLRKWLFRLLKRYNVTTITCTGHSLGGGVATLTAFGVADLLERQWDSWEGRRKKQGWKTMVRREHCNAQLLCVPAYRQAA
jgi:hypothetical protein